MTNRTAHMTPGLWALWAATVGLAAGTLILSAAQLVGAQQGPGAGTLNALSAAMIIVLFAFGLRNRRRRSQWVNRADAVP